jgi:hypothetical protein
MSCRVLGGTYGVFGLLSDAQVLEDGVFDALVHASRRVGGGRVVDLGVWYLTYMSAEVELVRDGDGADWLKSQTVSATRTANVRHGIAC